MTVPPIESATVGDVRQPTLDVYAYDGTPGDVTTTATVTVTPPEGVTAPTVTVTTADGGATWVGSVYTLSAAGRWIETWSVTGKGAQTKDFTVLVHLTPAPGGPTWLPTREQVAALIPRRTHVGAATGWGQTLGTFTDETRPLARDVDALIVQAGQWVELVAGTITNTTVAEQATMCAAMRVAGLIELTWPDNRDDLSDAQTLLKEADKLRKDVAAANITVTTIDPVTPTAPPYWSFPDPTTYGDTTFW